MKYLRIATLAIMVLGAALAAKNKSGDETQTLELPKDPPMVAIGETSHLIFTVSPLSAKGLLSQQTREALKAILKASGGAEVVHLRAFVTGSGDVRRVPQIVSEVFTARRMQLPSVSVIQAGALPVENAQVVIEAVSSGKKELNPGGLTFVEAESPEQLASNFAAASVLKVSCFLSSLNGAGAIVARFPSAVVDVVQTRRISSGAGPGCEAVVRGGRLKSPRLAFTGTQVAFGTDERAATLAFQRLDRDLSAAGVQAGAIVQTHIYSLTQSLGELARKVRSGAGEFSIIPFEGIASADGTFAVDAIATLP